MKCSTLQEKSTKSTMNMTGTTKLRIKARIFQKYEFWVGWVTCQTQVVVFFNAVWCPPCRMIKSDFLELAHSHKRDQIVFLEVNVDKARVRIYLLFLYTFHFYRVSRMNAKYIRFRRLFVSAKAKWWRKWLGVIKIDWQVQLLDYLIYLRVMVVVKLIQFLNIHCFVSGQHLSRNFSRKCSIILRPYTQKHWKSKTSF